MQCLLLVRDEFTVAVHRFMKSLGCEVRDNLNYQLIDLFDADFAREVLFEYGRGDGRLPDKLAELTNAQRTFLDRVIADLRDEDGKVVTVQLALLAQMLEGQPWTPAALDQIGGAAGIGRAFLEEKFDKRSASAECQLHRAAAIKLFEALLPEVGTAIKGRSRSRKNLLESSGYAQRPDDFAELVQLLDGQLRIITPVETDDGPGYQLTHDYLVPSLRDWLTAKQKATAGPSCGWWNVLPPGTLCMRKSTLQPCSAQYLWLRTCSPYNIHRTASCPHGGSTSGISDLQIDMIAPKRSNG